MNHMRKPKCELCAVPLQKHEKGRCDLCIESLDAYHELLLSWEYTEKTKGHLKVIRGGFR